MDTQTVDDLAATVAELAAQFQQLRLASMSGSTVVPDTSVRAVPTLLEPRPIVQDVQMLVRTAAPTSLLPPSETLSASRSQKAPPQPFFNGTDYPIFIQRYTRWLKVAGLDGLGDEHSRAWFLSANRTRSFAIG